MRPFYKNLKVSDEVLVKDMNVVGIVEKLLPNPYIQFFWQYPNYLVVTKNENCEGRGVFKRSELKLIK